ncbi:MAG: hydrogenase maturation protease [Thermosynechococcaceae cyanobacterium]
MKTLVIGYGNSLRGDDGVGPLVAEQVAEWNLPEVRSLFIHQLTPELAADIAQVETVFFIDAWQIVNTQSPPSLVGDLGSECKIERLFPTPSPTSLDHTWSPNTLLYLAKILYDADPITYHILIPAIQFNYGETLSTIASDGLTWSIKALKNYLASPQSLTGRICHA